MAIDWIQLFKKYKGQWVALEDDEKTVISFGHTASDARNKSQLKGVKNPILTKIPEKIISYVGFGNDG